MSQLYGVELSTQTKTDICKTAIQVYTYLYTLYKYYIHSYNTFLCTTIQ